VIGTSLLTDAAWGSIVFGLFLITGGWLVGSGRRATVVRRRERPGAARPRDLLPRRARPPARCCSWPGAPCRGRARSGPC
jgi:hypothetical protein